MSDHDWKLYHQQTSRGAVGRPYWICTKCGGQSGTTPIPNQRVPIEVPATEQAKSWGYKAVERKDLTCDEYAVWAVMTS
jgi:hypothetical protein